MDYRMLSSLESVVFIGTFLIATYLLIPKSFDQWRLWEKTGKYVHLSNSFGAGIAAIFLLVGNMIKFIQAVVG